MESGKQAYAKAVSASISDFFDTTEANGAVLARSENVIRELNNYAAASTDAERQAALDEMDYLLSVVADKYNYAGSIHDGRKATCRSATGSCS